MVCCGVLGFCLFACFGGFCLVVGSFSFFVCVGLFGGCELCSLHLKQTKSVYREKRQAASSSVKRFVCLKGKDVMKPCNKF